MALSGSWPFSKAPAELDTMITEKNTNVVRKDLQARIVIFASPTHNRSHHGPYADHHC
jgi:hypothetical protein